MKNYKRGYLNRITALLLAVLMLVALPSCNDADGEETTVTAVTTEAPAPQDPIPPDVEMLPAQEVRILSQNVLAASKLEDIESRAPTMIEYFLDSNADSIGVARRDKRGSREDRPDSGRGSALRKRNGRCGGSAGRLPRRSRDRPCVARTAHPRRRVFA